MATKTKQKTGVTYLLLYIMTLSVTFCRSVPQIPAPGCHLKLRKSFEDYEYYQDGDIIIGGVFTVNQFMAEIPQNKIVQQTMCLEPSPQNYKNFLTFQFAIEELNRALLLPNITVGYHVYDSCNDANKAIKSVLQILSGPGRTVPNYSCTERGKVVGFIGDHHSLTTVPIAQLLAIYPYSQISYGATNPVLGNRLLYPTFFRTLQNDRTIYSMLSKVLEHFGWTWIGILASDDDSGETEAALLIKYMAKRGICVAFTLKMSFGQYNDKGWRNARNADIIRKSSSNVIVLCGTFSQTFRKCLFEMHEVLRDRTMVLNPNWANSKFLMDKFTQIFNGSLLLANFPIHIPNIGRFFMNIVPANYPADKLLEHLTVLYFNCCSSDSFSCHRYGNLYRKRLRRCSAKDLIVRLNIFNYDGIFSRVFMAVLVTARALSVMPLFLYNKDERMEDNIYYYKHQLHHYLNNITFSLQDGPPQGFDENGDFVTSFRILNWINWMITGTLNKSSRTVGKFNSSAKDDQQILINESAIIWKNGVSEIPISRCSDICQSGSRKIPNPGRHPCCYECVPCSEGQISNTTDSENCLRCQNEEWPNLKRDSCISKIEEFLSYRNDEISAVFICISVSFFLITLLILGVFISHRETPIVKANNKNLSFLLLVSIMLNFLCVFFFLGRPADVTCMLRQISFGILFSIAVSSVLAKTVMVCIAFKATKPGNVWRRWVGVTLPNCIVFICSSVQVIISIIWLSISPPFQERDTHSYQRKIIVQCNEGSVIGFYSVLGYMGILATVSFLLAFIARTLPDSFNETKYITFSMLVFCSVWIALIPAYLSTKGKDMVAVEIFSILTSNAGLLCCIFLPKCYIILCRPELNTKLYLLDYRKA